MSGPRSILSLFESAGATSSAKQAAATAETEPSNAPKVMQVSELCRDARTVLEGRFPRVHVQGEVANFMKHRSGHWYFSLKDAYASVKAVMFGSDNRLVKFAPKDGVQVTVVGRVSLYEQQGGFQLIVGQMRLAGDGALSAAYEALKAKLEAEGLFHAGRKKPLPGWPRCVGVVTSTDGAALRDILTVLKRRAPDLHVVVSPARVQGASAGGEVAMALRRLERTGRADVIIVGRGGGSAEDLSAFNDEGLARVIAVCKVPVVSAVGHETDVTICDWVADMRAPTPSAAAELVAPDRAEVRKRIDAWQQRLVRATSGRLNAARLKVLETQRRLPDVRARLQRDGQHLDEAEARMHAAMVAMVRSRQQTLESLSARLNAAHPVVSLRAQRQRMERAREGLDRGMRNTLDTRRKQMESLNRRLSSRSPQARVHGASASMHELAGRMQAAMRRRLDGQQRRLATDAARLDALSPLSVLSRGYALVTRASDGRVVRAPVDAPVGERLTMRLSQGTLQATSGGALPDDDQNSGGQQ